MTQLTIKVSYNNKSVLAKLENILLKEYNTHTSFLAALRTFVHHCRLDPLVFKIRCESPGSYNSLCVPACFHDRRLVVESNNSFLFFLFYYRTLTNVLPSCAPLMMFERANFYNEGFVHPKASFCESSIIRLLSLAEQMLGLLAVCVKIIIAIATSVVILLQKLRFSRAFR